MQWEAIRVLIFLCFVGNCAGNVDLLWTKDAGFMLEPPSRLSWETISSVSKPLNLIKPGSGHSPQQGRMKGMKAVTQKEERFLSLSLYEVN